MNMHAEQELPEQPSTSRKRNRQAAFKLGIIASGVLLLALAFFPSRPTPADDKVIWLTPGELARIKRGGTAGANEGQIDAVDRVALEILLEQTVKP